VGIANEPGAFEWWVPHDRALRRARALFLLGAFVAASYVVAPLFVLVLVWRAGQLRALDVVLVTVAAVATLAGVMTIVAMIAWRGVPRVMLRRAGARPARADEDSRVRARLAAVAIARGIAVPHTWMVDADAPNAFVMGRAERGHACFTIGALALPDDELDALCAFVVTALTCRPFAYCTSAIDVVLLVEWCTRIVWACAFALLLSAAIGVPFEVAGTITLCLAGTIALTRLALVVADRALPHLLDDATGMVDLEAIGRTERPAPFLRLLRRVDRDDERVTTSWPIAHLWFDRDEQTVPGPQRFAAPMLALRCERSGAQARTRRLARIRHLADRPI